MFYSHTFLARKGPLGTVWIAAHLQHKLKKSHITSTHIPSTVDRIMCPEVPIALRMSGHLLLGVVRIYLKKVDYLHHDCSILWDTLRNAFKNVNVNLPEHTANPPPSAVTLPDTFLLDRLDLDHLHFDDDLFEDHHLKSHEEITIQGENYGEGEFYVRIVLEDDGDVTPLMSRSEGSPPRDDPMLIDKPSGQTPQSSGNLNVGPSMGSEDGGERFGPESSLPDIETLRDYVGNDDVNQQINQVLASTPDKAPPESTEKEFQTPVERGKLSVFEEPLLQSPQRSGPSSSPTDGAPVISDSFVNATPENLSLRPSPTPVNANLEDLQLRRSPTPVNPPKRKIKQLFDKSLVLSNEFMKKTLNDYSNLVKKRKKLPCSNLDIWRAAIKRKKDHVFSEPLMSGMCADLQNLSGEDFSSVKLDSRVPQSPTAPIVSIGSEGIRSPDKDHDNVPDFDAQPEQLRSPDGDPGHCIRPEPVFSPLQRTPSHSQDNAENISPSRIPSPIAEPSTVNDTESRGGLYSSRTGSEINTPVTDFEEGYGAFSANLSDIPEIRDSRASDDLSFLEQDNDTPPDYLRSHEGDSMSVRTRAVAQYLRDHSPLCKYSDRSVEDLSLSNILEGRSRKLCARMFYETLLLKNYGLIDVRQDEPYGDITLKLTPTFATAKI